MIRHKDYLLVTVPSMAFGFDVNNYGDSSEFMFMIDMGEIDKEFESDETLITKELPKGKWEFIGLASELTEEQWREIVDWYGVGDGSVDEAGVGDIFWCYDESDFCFDTAIKSGKSLLKYQNLQPNQTVILKLIQ